MSLLTELAAYTAAQVSGLTAGTNLFRGFMPQSPDVCVAIYEYPGGPPVLGLGAANGISLENPSAQWVVRGEPEDYDTPRATAELIWLAVSQIQCSILSGTQYYLPQPLQSPFKLKQDDNKRVYIAFNASIEKEPS